MAIFNENIGLNIAVFSILLVANIIILICCFLDNFRKIKRYFKFFIIWVLFEMVFLAENIVILILRYLELPQSGINIAAALSYIAVSGAYAAAGRLIVGIISEKTHIPPAVKYIAYFGTVPMMLLSVIYISNMDTLYYKGFYSITPGIIIYTSFFLYLLFIGYTVIHYRKFILMPEPVLLIMMLIIPQLLSMQSIWITVPSAVARTMFIVASFFRIWQERVKRISAEQARLAKYRVELESGKIDIMLSRINPDFLYSTLNSVAAKCKTNPEEAEKLTLEFSSYLRQTIHSLNGKGVYPFSFEQKYIRSFLFILSSKTNGKYTYSISPAAREFTVPALSVYMLVEKAEKQLPYGGEIRISTEIQGRHSVVYVSLKGAGIRYMKKPVNDVVRLLTPAGGTLSAIKTENGINYTVNYVESAL